MMPKVIVINNIDGHVNVFEWNIDNAKALAEGCLAANEYTTMMYDGDVKAIRELLDWPDSSRSWLDAMASVIDEAVDGHDNHVNLIDIETELTVEAVRRMLW
jgi:hypothetical protein